MVKKKEVIAIKESVKEGFIKKTSGQISEFFNHLIAYGGFSINEGVMKIWGDPSLFVPINAFLLKFHELEGLLGKKDCHDLFYWLGRLYGKNSTIMLMNRYGLNRENLPDFLNGATQDGMGYLKIQDYDDKNFNYGTVISNNSTFALAYAKKYGNTKEPIDFYLAGILSGGIDPLVDKISIVTEKKCMAKGEKECLYEFKPLLTQPNFNFLKKCGFKQDNIFEKTRAISLRRKSEFKIIGKKEIQFGDGKFILKGETGVNIPVYGSILLDKCLIDLISLDKLRALYRLIAQDYIGLLKKRLVKRELKEVLKELEIFCYGRFNIKLVGTKKVIITNVNNPYPEDYIQIFGRSKEPVDIFVCLLIEESLKINNRKAEVKELNCRACGDKECIFEISFS